MKKLLLFATLAALTPVMQGARPERASSQEQTGSRRAVSINIDVPFEMTPTADEAALFTLIDANGDNKKWAYRSNFGGLVSPSNDNMNSDDWAITPGLRVTDTSSNYEFAFTMKHNMRGPSFASSFEFYIGTSPDVASMTTLIGRIDGFYCETANVAVPQSIAFAFPGGPGTYYLGIRCISPKLENGVSPWPCTFQNLSMHAMQTAASAPLQPTDVTATPGAEGALSTTVTFTMPATSMNGAALPADTPLTAVLTSSVETQTATALPGTAVTMNVATVQGDNVLSLQVNGDVDGEPLQIPIYTGVVLPKRVHDLSYTLSPDNMTMNITWTPPTEGENGGYIDYDNLEYQVYISDTQDLTYRLLANVGNALAYSYTMSAGAQLRTVRLKVLAANAAGVSTDDVNWIGQDPVMVSDMLGTPYAIPAVENFDNKDMAFTPLTILRPNEDYAGRWTIDDPSGCVADENQSALIAYSPYDEGSTLARVALPKFSTLGQHNVAFTLKAMRYSGYTTWMDVYARNHDEELTLLGRINCAAGQNDWIETSFPLPAQFQNKDWVQIVIDADLADVDYIYAIDSYKLAVTAANDVAMMGLDSADALMPHSAATFTATLTNFGFSTVSPQVRFSATDAEGTLLAEQTVDVNAMTPGASTTVTWVYTPHTGLMDSEITITAQITTPDEVEANDAKSLVAHVRRTTLPAVNDLTATLSPMGVTLNWNEPLLHRTIDESVESVADFYYGEQLGTLRGVDMDGQSVYKFANIEMPNEQLPKAFIVVNPSQLTGSDLEAHTGDKFLMATCPERASTSAPLPQAANDWLITPQLQERSYVSFYWDIISPTYPETIRLMVSSTGDNPSDFTELKQIIKGHTGWEKVEIRLPEGARYFALNYVSRDMFGIFVDDVQFVSATDTHTLTDYEVYRDNERIGRTVETTFTDPSPMGGQTYDYHLICNTDGGASVKSNVTSVYADDEILSGIDSAMNATSVRALKGGVEVSGCDSFNICDASGMVITTCQCDGATRFVPLAPGVYMVGIGHRTFKVMVR